MVFMPPKPTPADADLNGHNGVDSRRRSACSLHPNGQEFIRVLNQQRSARRLQFVAAAETP